MSIAESAHIHFKPSNRRTCLNLSLFIFDILFAIAFQIGHMYFMVKPKNFEGENGENGHVLHVLIGVGFTGIMLFYSFSDGVRFLRSYPDKILYLISCLL